MGDKDLTYNEIIKDLLKRVEILEYRLEEAVFFLNDFHEAVMPLDPEPRKELVRCALGKAVGE